MRDYKCVTDLMQKLSDAADEVISFANAHYNGEHIGPHRALISDLQEEHGFDEQYIPLLVEMLNERSDVLEFENIDDEIIAYRDQFKNLTQFFTPERLGELLGNTLEWIGENAAQYHLFDTLKKTIGMTNDEIKAAGFEFDVLDEETTSDFTNRMLKIPEIDSDMLTDWVQHAFEMAVIDEEEGVPRPEAREKMLNEFADTFERIEYLYSGTAAMIFNHKAGYVVHELYGAAAFIAGGGGLDEAYEMAQNGAFEGAEEPDENTGITMQ